MHLTRSDRVLLARAWVTVFLTRIALWFVPFRLLLRGAVVRDRTEIDPTRLAWAVCASAAYVPKATCLVRALAAQRLFARYGHDAEVRIGVAKPEGRFVAHAWLEYEGAAAIGESPVEYTPILIHGSPQAASREIEHFG